MELSNILALSGLAISNLLSLSVCILILFLFLLQRSSFKILFYLSISLILDEFITLSSMNGGCEVKAKTKLLQHFNVRMSYYPSES